MDEGASDGDWPVKRWLCAWLPNFSLQRLLAVRPELAGRAVALYAPRAGRGGLGIVARSAAAAQRGIAPGMPLAEAMSLTGGKKTRPSNPSAAADPPGRRERDWFFPEEPAADREAIEKIAQWAQRYSPLVSLQESERPDSIFLEVTGCGLIFHGEAALADRVHRGLAEQGWRARVAVADSPGAAWAVARHGSVSAAGWRIVPAGQTACHLAALPLSALRLPDEAMEILGQLGIERVDQLARLPRGELAARLGSAVLDRLDEATGDAGEVLVLHRPLPFVETRQDFEYPVDRLEGIEPFLPAMIERLLEGLRPGQAIQHLACRMGHEGRPPAEFGVDLFQPSDAPAHFLELLRLRLERWTLQAPIVSLSLIGSAIVPAGSRQGLLFGEGVGADRPRQLARLIDRLSSRLGKESVLQPRRRPDAQPEHACRFEPAVGRAEGVARGRPDSPRSKKAKSEPKPAPPSGRPLRLARVPLPIVAKVFPPEGPPGRFCIAERPGEYRLVRAWGPERIETGWWHGPAVRRDYYRVQTAEGPRLWLFRRLDDARWFLHGWFE